MPKDYAEETKLQQHQGRVQMALDASKAMVEYSKMAIRGSFFLNGAAVIAIITAKEPSLYDAAFRFACGAFTAIICAGLSYATQFFLERKLSSSITGESPHKYMTYIAEGLRWIAVLFFVLSSLLFVLGLQTAYDSLHS